MGTRFRAASGAWLIGLMAVAVAACRGGNVGSGNQPAGDARTGTTGVLETAATALQNVTPVGQIDVHLVGFHPMKDDPAEQVTSHHYCNQLNEDFAQCVLFDGNTKTANLHGVEFIISEKLFETLPAGERGLWHPHNYEILSGQLVGPGLPGAAEKQLMRRKMNSYGKTWHFWKTGVFDQPGDKLPLGKPMLAWSFNRDGEAVPGLIDERDGALGIDSEEKRRERSDLADLAHPQEGVDALLESFPNATGAPDGVRDKQSRTQ